jgi:hypothetical protein
MCDSAWPHMASKRRHVVHTHVPETLWRKNKSAKEA